MPVPRPRSPACKVATGGRGRRLRPRRTAGPGFQRRLQGYRVRGGHGGGPPEHRRRSTLSGAPSKRAVDVHRRKERMGASTRPGTRRGGMAEPVACTGKWLGLSLWNGARGTGGAAKSAGQVEQKPVIKGPARAASSPARKALGRAFPSASMQRVASLPEAAWRSEASPVRPVVTASIN